VNFPLELAVKKINRHSLIINLDYCGTCHGTCSGCLLSTEEKDSTESFLTLEKISHCFAEISKPLNYVEQLAIGIGRGNALALQDQSWDILKQLGEIVQQYFNYGTCTLEVATSLIGHQRQQLDKAKALIDWYNQQYLNIDCKFVVISNPGLTSKNYWKNIQWFLSELALKRGGGENSADILVLNLMSDSLPSLKLLEPLLQQHHGPINIFWASGVEFKYLSENVGFRQKIKAVSHWLEAFFQRSKKLGLDCNLNNMMTLIKSSNELETKEVLEQLNQGKGSLIFIDKNADMTWGDFTVLGEIDPVRQFNPGQTNDYDRHHSGKNIHSEIKQLFRHSACQQCDYFSVCLMSGGYKTAALNIKLQESRSVSESTQWKQCCPSALKSVFEMALN
jgi:hypothetical protein